MFFRVFEAAWAGLISRGGLANRFMSSPASSDVQPLSVWLMSNHATPPVDIKSFQGMAAPSALSWLRRRGLNDAHHGVLYRLFRQVRLYS